MTINVIYWSGTGNTQQMAELIAQGAREAGAEVAVIEVDSATPGDVAACDVVLFGCPSMGAEVLEEGSFEPFIESIEGDVGGKKMGLFGSYGWGDGEWMRDFTERMQTAGAQLVVEALIVNEAPEGEAVAQCIAFGKDAAQ